MTSRMFAAVVPPPSVREELSEFLEPRREFLRWIDPDQWHLTLAFCAAVPDHRVEDLADALGEVATRHSPFTLALGGAGAFPDPVRAKVLWLDVAAGAEPLGQVALSARNAANAVGAAPDGATFVPHLTLARLRRPIEATKWLRVLGSWIGARWPVTELRLIESHLGEGPAGRPRYETVATAPLGR